MSELPDTKNDIGDGNFASIMRRIMANLLARDVPENVEGQQAFWKAQGWTQKLNAKAKKVYRGDNSVSIVYIALAMLREVNNGSKWYDVEKLSNKKLREKACAIEANKMNVCIGLMFQNEAPWLKLHLSHLRDYAIVAVDGGSTDGSADVIRDLGGVVYERPFDWDFSAQGNYLIDCCEREGYHAMIRLDPDETMFASHIEAVQVRLAFAEEMISLPRYNFVKDRRHYNPLWYPDNQTRGIPLHKGVRYSGDRVHELPQGLPVRQLPGIHIYHYGWIKDPAELAVKTVSYVQAEQGLPVEGITPPDNPEYPDYVLFTGGEQPLDPAMVGERAPVA